MTNEEHTVEDLHLQNLTKRFGDFVAVDDLTLTIPAGSFFALLGGSGCGKTTTLRMIAGLDAPTGGQILIDGRDVTTLGPAERNVSMVFQSYALFPHMSVIQNVSYGLVVSGVGKDEATRRARAAMESVGLDPGAPAATVLVRLASSRVAPLTGQSMNSLVLSEDATRVTAAWEQDTKSVTFCESTDTGWTAPVSLTLTGNLTRDAAYKLINDRVRGH